MLPGAGTAAFATTVAKPARTGEAPARLASVDVIRGLTILVMIFVNDVAGVAGTPGWMKHIEPPAADGMTFVDVVFPAFLFIVGLAIPLALERRVGRESRADTWRHVLARTFGLLVIGVFMVNGPVDDVLPRELWTLLMYAGVVLVWVRLPAADARTTRVLRVVGIALLLLMAVLYRGRGEPGLIELRPHWWGILGLIGWAYLVAAGVYLLARDRLLVLGTAVVALYGLFMINALGWLPRVPYLNIGSMLGSHAALTLSGALAGAAMFLPTSPFRAPGARIRFALGFGALMALAAVALHTGRDVHPMFIINKIAATPAWCLWSAAITIWIWALAYWLFDARPSTPRVPLLELSGQNALLAYILAPVFYAVVARTSTLLDVPNYYARLGSSFGTGFTRALLFALFVCWVAAALRRRDVVLKL